MSSNMPGRLNPQPEVMSKKQRLSKVMSDFSASMAESTGGALVQVWMPEQCADGSLVLSAQGLPFAVVGVGDLLALFRCVSVRYRFSTDVNKPALMGAIGRVYASTEPEMSRDVQKYDKQVYLRVSEAQRCRVHSTLVVPLFSCDMPQTPFAIFELVQSDKECAFPAVMSWLQRCLETVKLSMSGTQERAMYGISKWPVDVEQHSAHQGRQVRARRLTAEGDGQLDTPFGVVEIEEGGDDSSSADNSAVSKGSGRKEAVAASASPKQQGPDAKALVPVSEGMSPPASRAPATVAQNATVAAPPPQQQQEESGNFQRVIMPSVSAVSQSAGGLTKQLNSENDIKATQAHELVNWMSQNGIGPEAFNTLKAMLMQGKNKAVAAQQPQEQQQQQPAASSRKAQPVKIKRQPSEPIPLTQTVKMSSSASPQELNVLSGSLNETMLLSSNQQQQQVLQYQSEPGKGLAAAAAEDGSDDDDIGSGGEDEDEDEEGRDGRGGKGGGNNRVGGGAGKRLRYEDLQAQFGLGLKEAANNLGICATTLKRACRRHGIKRWPRRQIVKLSKALNQMGYEGAPPPMLVQSAVKGQLASKAKPAAAAQVKATEQAVVQPFPMQQMQMQQMQMHQQQQMHMHMQHQHMHMQMHGMPPGSHPQMQAYPGGAPAFPQQMAMLQGQVSGLPGMMHPQQVHPHHQAIQGHPQQQNQPPHMYPSGMGMQPMYAHGPPGAHAHGGMPMGGQAAAGGMAMVIHQPQDSLPGVPCDSMSMGHLDFLDSQDLAMMVGSNVNNANNTDDAASLHVPRQQPTNSNTSLAALQDLFKNAPGGFEGLTDLLNEDMHMVLS